MSLSRRQFIKASGVALCAGAAPLKAQAAGQQPALPIPSAGVRRGQPLFLTLQRALVVYARYPRLGVGLTVAIWGQPFASGTATMSS